MSVAYKGQRCVSLFIAHTPEDGHPWNSRVNLSIQVMGREPTEAEKSELTDAEKSFLVYHHWRRA